MEFRNITEEEFKEFALNHKYKSFFQTVETGLLREKNGWKKHFVGIIKDNKVIAATLLVSIKSFLGKNKFYAPRGFLIDYNDYELLTFFTKEIKRYVKNNNGFYIKIDPYIPYKERDIDGKLIKDGFNNQSIIDNLIKLNYKHYGFTLYQDKTEQVRWMFVLNLENKTEEQILKEMKQSTRTRINKTLKYNYKIKELEKNDLEHFYEILKSTGERRNFGLQSLKYFKDFYDIYSKNNMVKYLLIQIDLDEYLSILNNNIEGYNENKEYLLDKLKNNDSKNTKTELNSVEKDIEDLKQKIEETENFKKEHGNILDLSAAMFITYGDEIIYLSSGSYEEFMTLNGQYLTQWEMIKYGIKNKFKRYNFYGISGNFDTKDSQYGIYNFKRGFNGYVVELIGEFDLPVTYHYYIYSFLKKLKNIIK